MCRNGDVLTYASYFPDDSPYLLIAHGGKDENVHFAHTASLLQRLNALGKPYHLSVRTDTYSPPISVAKEVSIWSDYYSFLLNECDTALATELRHTRYLLLISVAHCWGILMRKQAFRSLLLACAISYLI